MWPKPPSFQKTNSVVVMVLVTILNITIYSWDNLGKDSKKCLCSGKYYEENKLSLFFTTWSYCSNKPQILKFYWSIFFQLSPSIYRNPQKCGLLKFHFVSFMTQNVFHFKAMIENRNKMAMHYFHWISLPFILVTPL